MGMSPRTERPMAPGYIVRDASGTSRFHAGGYIPSGVYSLPAEMPLSRMDLAIEAAKAKYVLGAIDVEEFERLVGVLLGLEVARSAVRLERARRHYSSLGVVDLHDMEPVKAF